MNAGHIFNGVMLDWFASFLHQLCYPRIGHKFNGVHARWVFGLHPDVIVQTVFQRIDHALNRVELARSCGFLPHASSSWDEIHPVIQVRVKACL